MTFPMQTIPFLVLQILPDDSTLYLFLTVVVPAFIALWVYRDATRRNNEYPSNWAISMFLFGFLGFLPIFVGLGLWWAVRDER